MTRFCPANWSTGHHFILFVFFNLYLVSVQALPTVEKRALNLGWLGPSNLNNGRNLGIGAMQMAVTGDNELIILDKAENNPLQINGRSAWGLRLNIRNGQQTPLNLSTNSFCAGGGWLGNGKLISVGGDQPQWSNSAAAPGLQAIRFFGPFNGVANGFQAYENITTYHLDQPRWYASGLTLQDGSMMVIGGTASGGFNNNQYKNVPSYEFIPPRGGSIYLDFLVRSLNSNLFPIAMLMPKTGYIFMAANTMAILYDPVNKQEYQLPNIPNNVVITYPASGLSTLLPLTIANGFTPSVLFCGGVVSSQNLESNPSGLDGTAPTSTQCSRMILQGTGTGSTWVTETMPSPRIMGNAVLMPDGKVLLVNGASSGVAGYGNLAVSVGSSNAAFANYQPVLYDPEAVAGSRFSSNFPSSSTERLYHSVAGLVPDGRVFIAGSNPNDAVSTTKYATRFNTEFLSPPYMSLPRPLIKSLPSQIGYNMQYDVSVSLPVLGNVQAVLISFGYITHGLSMNQRWLELKCTVSRGRTVRITAPQDSSYFPPSPGWLFILVNGVPSQGRKVLVGPGTNPNGWSAMNLPSNVA